MNNFWIGVIAPILSLLVWHFSWVGLEWFGRLNRVLSQLEDAEAPRNFGYKSEKGS